MGTRGGNRAGAGRKKGEPNKDKRLLQSLITDAIAKNCIKNLVALADGGLNVEKTTKDGKTKVYVTEPNYFANAYLLDQKFGKPRQSIDAQVDSSIKFQVEDLTK